MKVKQYNITVVGSGYVGMSLAVLLGQHNKVTVLDIDQGRISKINLNKTTVADKDIESALKNNKLNIVATINKHDAYKDSNFVVIATPTDFNSKTNKFNTDAVDSVVADAVKSNPGCFIVIKSTIPVGHTSYLQSKHNTDRIIFSPEFLREGKALYDNLYPSRIIIGSKCKSGKVFGNILSDAAKKQDIKILFVQSKEAESIKLFSNTYLAMRVSFFNELDSFALANNLDTKSIIDGVCLDERIGDGYNNPSFGYGGYCLPKDTKQLLANYENIPQNLMDAIVLSNNTRKDFISKEILKLSPKTVGFYRLVMKEGSDNFRFSAIQGIIKRIESYNIKVVIYEPKILTSSYLGSKVISDIDIFKATSDIIVANRVSESLIDVMHKCFSRDIFKIN